MTPVISVIICTHNPREDYMSCVLAALREQTFALNQWDLVVGELQRRIRSPTGRMGAEVPWAALRLPVRPGLLVQFSVSESGDAIGCWTLPAADGRETISGIA